MTSGGAGQLGEIGDQDTAVWTPVAADDAWVTSVLTAVVDAENALFAAAGCNSTWYEPRHDPSTAR